jgi:hypothetical protein
MTTKSHTKPLLDYLDSLGILEQGSDAEIKAAKHAYRKHYLLAFKRKQRAARPEFTVNFSKDNGEYERIERAAKRHTMTVTAFVHSAALAYIDNTFLVPNREQVARLEQILSQCLNEIKTITSKKEKFFWEQEKKLDAIEKRIEKLEEQINNVFRNPPLQQPLSIKQY